MKFRQLVDRLGGARDWQEAVTAARAEHGRGASRWLAAQHGVSQRTAQKWLKGVQAPASRARRAAVTAGANRRYVAAQAMRSAQSVRVGRVKVAYADGKPTDRNVRDLLEVDDRMRARFAGAADALESGDYDSADRGLSSGVLGGYGVSGDGLDWLNITDYGPEFDFL